MRLGSLSAKYKSSGDFATVSYQFSSAAEKVPGPFGHWKIGRQNVLNRLGEQ
ncbi:hypothetical protein Ga0466249_003363 [Sporomusaceae bacterium BoRhaA]|uniref:hypothetical protein n=1 Tax=Pelorhabdus rhamnosifermentans TaxID=2772457 RepID=UPI001C05F3CA|nr:hypothetical protein [Pelorhabdus rhamnosifermentans]MBU2702236.1 hypothetical protein [Pelorhabdus rhamnosifermentans]